MNMDIRILNNILADQVQNKIISSHQTMCCVSLACSDVSTFAFHKCDTSILQLKNKAIWLSKYMQRKYVIQYNILSSSQKLVNTEWRKGMEENEGMREMWWSNLWNESNLFFILLKKRRKRLTAASCTQPHPIFFSSHFSQIEERKNKEQLSTASIQHTLTKKCSSLPKNCKPQIQAPRLSLRV